MTDHFSQDIATCECCDCTLIRALERWSKETDGDPSLMGPLLAAVVMLVEEAPYAQRSGLTNNVMAYIAEQVDGYVGMAAANIHDGNATIN